jgi:hypothetical protein
LVLSKGSPLPFEIKKGSHPVFPQHWVVFFKAVL